MKVKQIYEFDLPEENHEKQIMDDAMKYYLIIEELKNKIRHALKYEELTDEQTTVYEKISDTLYELSEGAYFE